MNPSIQCCGVPHLARLVLAMFVGAGFFLLADTCYADTIHIDSCIDRPGDGSQSSPHRTLTEAVALAAPGDTIIVQSGAYPESVIMKRELTITSSGGPVLVGEYHVASEEVCVPIKNFIGSLSPGSCPENDESSHVNAKVYYPSRDGPTMACGGPFPAIVYAHGFRNPDWVLCDGSVPVKVHKDYRQAEGILRRLAASGIIVISVDFAGADGPQGLTSEKKRTSIILNTIAYLQDENTTGDSPLQGGVDLSRLGLVGHSIGGRAAMIAALGFHGGSFIEQINELNIQDVHIQALGLIAPARPALPIDSVPVLVIHGTNEHPRQVNGFPLAGYIAANPPKHFVVLTGANHFGYTDGICLDPDDDKDNPSMVGGVTGQEARARQQLTVHHYLHAFLSHYLRGKAGAIDHLLQGQGEQCKPDATTQCVNPRRPFKALDTLNVDVSVCSCKD